MGDRIVAEPYPRRGLLPHRAERGQIMNETVFSQIMDIRDSGRVNMFDAPAVQRMAFEMGFYELVCFIEEDRATYVRFILTGEK